MESRRMWGDGPLPTFPRGPVAAIAVLLCASACNALLGIEDAPVDSQGPELGADASAGASGCPPGDDCESTQSCSDMAPCRSGQICIEGACRAVPPDAADARDAGGDASSCGAQTCKAEGEDCLNAAECASGVCSSGTCRPDCSPECDPGASCTASDDCSSTVCTDGTCRVDCSPDCAEGLSCVGSDDCATGVCTDGTCRPACSPTCPDGADCTLADDCASDACISGTCRPACSPGCSDGAGCLDESDCSSSVCVSETCRPACYPDCPVGDSCTTNDDCVTGICTGGTCRPACSPECDAGQTCVADDDCTETCHPTAGVCLETCVGDRTVTNAITRDDIRYCSTITGNLNLEPTEPLSGGALDPNDFLPYLKSVGLGVILFTGTSHISTLILPDLESAGALALSTQGDLISFPKLTTVGPKGTTPMPAEIYVTGGFETLDLPALTSVTGDVQFTGGADLTRIHAPELTTVTGDFLMTGGELTDVNLFELGSIGGNLNLEFLCTLRYAEVSGVAETTVVGGTKTISEIGCCTLSQSACEGTSCVCSL